MPIYDHKTLPYNDFQAVSTVPNKDSPAGDRYSAKKAMDDASKKTDPAVIAAFQAVHPDQPVTRHGLGTAIKGGTKNWQTKVTWQAIEATSSDGTGFEATMLGPDHKQGSKPESGISKNATNLNKAIKKNANDGYVKGHLLNDNLGGPGNDERNLAAIPRTTNTGGMLKHIEEPLKAKVNDLKGWVYLKGAVTFGKWTDPKTSVKYKYAKKLVYDWHDLKVGLGGDPEEVAGTKAHVELDVPPPDDYDNADYATPGKKTYGVASKTGKTDDKLAAATAVADVDWTAIVLDNWDSAKIRREVIIVVEQQLKDVEAATMKEVVDTICAPHDTTEDDALTWIKTESERYAKKGKPDPALPTKLAAYQKARNDRISAVLKGLATILDEKAPTQATGLTTALEAELRKGDPLAMYTELIGNMLAEITKLGGENEKLEKDKKDLDAHTVKMNEVEDNLMPMSPGQTADVYDQLSTDNSIKKDNDMKLAIKKRARDTDHVDEVLLAEKASKSKKYADKLFGIAKDNKATLAGADFSALQPAWPALYGTIRSFVDNTCDENAFQWALSGFYTTDARSLGDFIAGLEKFV